MSLDPYSAVLFASYGGPNGPDDVLPFMRNATRGKGIPDERLLEVAEHYMLFGGKSPINELNDELMAAFRAELDRRGVSVPVVIGNRNWEPYIGDVVVSLTNEGHERVVAIATSAYQSYSSCRQYCEDIVGAIEGHEIVVDKIDPFWDEPAFAESNATHLVESIGALRARMGEGRMRVLFVTHSIPITMNELSATGEPARRYDAQHLRVCELVAELAGQEVGEELDWELTYCSRSGPPHIPWLEPDVNDRLAEIKGEVDGVVLAPIGFISDHMEVVYDLDTEAAQTASDLGLEFERASTVSVDEAFVSMLADKVIERAAVARGEREPRTICRFDTGACCLARRPNTDKEHHGQAPKP